jgi:hypothetical protein
MAKWYGERKRRAQITANTAVWYHAGTPAVPRRWGLIRDPERRGAPQAWLATNAQLRPVQLLRDFVRRWQLEATFEEARAHRGVETPRQWSDQATARTTPALFALASVVPLRAAQLSGPQPMPARAAAWDRHAPATFSATLAVVRHAVGHQGHFSTSQGGTEVVKIPRRRYERVPETLCYAA